MAWDTQKLGKHRADKTSWAGLLCPWQTTGVQAQPLCPCRERWFCCHAANLTHPTCRFSWKAGFISDHSLRHSRDMNGHQFWLHGCQLPASTHTGPHMAHGCQCQLLWWVVICHAPLAHGAPGGALPGEPISSVLELHGCSMGARGSAGMAVE